MSDFFGNQRVAIFVNDICMVVLAWIATLLLCYNFHPPFVAIFTFLPYIILIQAISFYFCGLYRGIWRFASIPDVVRILKAVWIGVGFIVILYHLQNSIDMFLSVPIVYGILLLFFLSGPRVIYRWLKDYKKTVHFNERILIVGAGSAGESVVRDLTRWRLRGYQPVAFVDDDPKKIGQEIHGIRVKATCTAIPRLIKELNIQLVLIAMPSATSAEMRQIVNLCEEAKVAFCTLPSLKELAEGRVNVKTFREVSLEDLLGREEVNLHQHDIYDAIKNKMIMVSGAGGSIGSELCMQLARLQPASLILLDNAEFNLYSIDIKLRNGFPNLNLQSILCDITDKKAVQMVFEKNQPEIFFHAAAYKHVPLLESHLRKAIHNNVLGTKILAEAASHYHCKTFVLISTDKAVNPTNIMGATKRASEMLCQYFNTRSTTRFLTVRFGNVLNSAGSVVPLFRKQLSAGGPLTVTHPEITRFFMTIPEASQLIIQASTLGKGGEIFVLDMGEPIKIRYLAEQLIKLSGKVLGKDIEIKYTGLRPGEKLHEELFYHEEELSRTHHHKIRKARTQRRSMPFILKLLNEMEEAYQEHAEEKLLNLLCQLVPEYQQATHHKKEDIKYYQLSYSR